MITRERVIIVGSHPSFPFVHIRGNLLIHSFAEAHSAEYEKEDTEQS
jgi:hypothetical protein